MIPPDFGAKHTNKHENPLKINWKIGINPAIKMKKQT